MRTVSVRITSTLFCVLETSARLLRLLSLLQSRRSWQGPQLAEELCITERTVRRDVEKLRTLGYPVQATAGVAGGYRLAAGARLPPLLLDDNEALAVAFGLRSAAVGTVSGMEEAALRALDKLGQVLPERLRRRVAALHESFVATPFRGPRVDPDVLTLLASACEERRRLRFSYRDGKGTESERHVEPYGVVHTLSRWYLACWDLMREDWRTFRVDRLSNAAMQETRCAPRVVPFGDLATYVAQSIDTRTQTFRARVELLAPQTEVAQWMPWFAGQLTPLDEHRCLFEAGEQDLDRLAYYLSMMDVDFIVHEPRELLDHVQRMSARLARSVAASAVVE